MIPLPVVWEDTKTFSNGGRAILDLSGLYLSARMEYEAGSGGEANG